MRVVLMILIGVILWFGYDNYAKYEIKDYQGRQIEESLKTNYQTKRAKFEELVIFSEQIKTLQNVVFGNKEQVSFQVYDSLHDPESFDKIHIDIRNDSTYNSLQFLKDGAIEISSETGKLHEDNWLIDYEGEIDHPIVDKLLSYNSISIEELLQLQNKLKEINCLGFNKINGLITMRYEGHWGESYNYVIITSDIHKNENWNKLSENVFWEHYKNSLYCGWAYL